MAAGIVLALLWHGLWRLADVAAFAPFASLWFPPAGLTLALALTLGRNHVPVVLLTAVLGSMLSGGLEAVHSGAHGWFAGLGRGAVQGVVHALPFIVGAGIVGWAKGRWWRPGASASLVALVLALPAMAAGAATLGILVLLASGDLAPAAALDLVGPWLMGDLVGAATLGPVLALGFARPLALWLGGRTNPHLRRYAAHPVVDSRILALVAAAMAAVLLPVMVPGVAELSGAWGTLQIVAMVALLALALRADVLVTLTVTGLVGTGSAVVASQVLAPTALADAQAVVLVIAVVGQLGLAVQDLGRRAIQDQLTGLATRRRLLDVAARRFRRRHPLTMLLIDLDHFKDVNDRFGHAAGDAVLVTAAQELQRQLPADALMARMGGEEFAVLVRAETAGALTLADTLRRSLHEVLVEVQGQGISVRASIGIAVGTPSCSPRLLLARADEALYAAKRGGRDRVVLWHPDLAATSRTDTTPAERRV